MPRSFVLPSSAGILLVALGALSGFAAAPARAQVDANTLLYLSFNNTLNGAQGETPTSASNISFVSGVSGQAAFMNSSSALTYAASGNISATQGTLEFFVRPNWNGNDNQEHTFLSWGGGGGMLFSKDAANNLRGIFNRYGESNGPEVGVPGINASSWVAGQTYYLAYTWSNTTKEVQLYINGSLASSTTYVNNLPAVSASNFWVGSDLGAGFSPLNGSLDELRISSTVRSTAEIQARYSSFISPATAPEPGTWPLLAMGLLPLAGMALKRRRVVR
jgi:hypothetical protein